MRVCVFVCTCSLDWHAITRFALTHIYAAQKSRQLTQKDGHWPLQGADAWQFISLLLLHCAPVTDQNVEATGLPGFGIELLRSLTNYVKTQDGRWCFCCKIEYASTLLLKNLITILPVGQCLELFLSQIFGKLDLFTSSGVNEEGFSNFGALKKLSRSLLHTWWWKCTSSETLCLKKLRRWAVYKISIVKGHYKDFSHSCELRQWCIFNSKYNDYIQRYFVVRRSFEGTNYNAILNYCRGFRGLSLSNR